MTGGGKRWPAISDRPQSREKRQPVAILYAIRVRGYMAQFTQGKDVRGWRPNRMWFLFQSLIIFAVVASNIHWQWTPNGYLAGLIGVGLAYGLSAGLSEL
jgi:hypothetical protein